MRLILSALALLCAASLHGQDPVAQPRSLQSLQELLAKQKQVSWIQTPTTPGSPAEVTHVTASITAVKLDADACSLSLKDGRVFPDQPYDSVQTWQIKIPDVDRVLVESLEGFVNRVRSEGGHASWGTKTTPTVFVLEFLASPNHKFDVHRWSRNKDSEVNERDLQQPMAFVVFPDEAAAREAGKAVENAKALCATRAGAH